jgi:outer membrane protein
MSEIIKTLWLIAIALSLTGIVPCVSAQETAEPMDQATASQELTIDDNTVEMPLESVLLLALKNNLDITFARMQPEVAETDIMREEGQFDPLFSSQFSKYREKKQVANFLAGALPDDDPTAPAKEASIWQERYTFDAGLQKRFTLGTQADVSFRHRESSSDLPFAGLVPEYYSELVLGLTQPLLRDFGIEVGRSFIKIANLNYEVSEQQFRQQVMDVLYQAEAFYWDLYFRISDLENKQKSLERAQDFQRTFRIRIEAGTLAPIEIHQADAEVALRAQEVIVAEARVRNAEDNLKAVLNLYGDDRLWDVKFQPTDMPEKSLLEPVPAECIEIALENRPDIKQARLGLDISDVQVRYTKNQLMPRLDLFGSIGTNGLSGRNNPVDIFPRDPNADPPDPSPWSGQRKDSLEYMRDRDYYTYEIGIRLEFPLGNRVARSQHTRARIEKIQAATTLESVQNTIINDVRESIRLVETSRKVIDSSSATLRFTQEKLTAEEKKFDVGMSTAFAVLEFQADLANAETNLAFAYAEHRKAITNLKRVMGILLEEKGLVL